MESSRHKTFKQQITAQLISAIFVFIQTIYLSFFSANQIKGVRVASDATIRVMKNGKAGTMPIFGIEALETSKKRHESGF